MSYSERQHDQARSAVPSLGMGDVCRLGQAMKMRVFTDEERARTIAYYTETSAENFSLAVLSNELGRTRQFICRKAKELGLTNASRPNSAEHRSKSKTDWTKHQHPRGATGLKHTDDAKARMAAASRLAWVTAKTFGVGLMSEDHQQRRSDAMSAMRASQPAQNTYSRAKGGRRPDIGDMYFRSAWEANYARYLKWLQARGDIDRWEYEPETFWFLSIKRGVRSYKPDFRVWEKGGSYLVEIKGWMDPKSKTKLKRMKKYYPHERVDVVGPKQYADLKAKLSRIIPSWEAA